MERISLKSYYNNISHPVSRLPNYNANVNAYLMD